MNLAYCNQAEAIEAAAAQTAAQIPRDDSSAIIHKASFVSTNAPLYGQFTSLRPLAEEARFDTKMRSTSSSQNGSVRHCELLASACLYWKRPPDDTNLNRV